MVNWLSLLKTERRTHIECRIEGYIMLIKDKNKWCWVDDYGNAGEPQDTIQEAINDFMDCKSDLKEMWLTDESEQVVRIGHPNYYTPEVDAERVIEDIINYDIDDEIVEWDCDYLANVKTEHLDELRAALTKVFCEWEKKYGYENKGHVVLEKKSYPVDSKGRLIVV